MKTPREIIGELLQAIEENNLDWDVNINNNNTVTAVFESPITKNKTLNYMIVYHHLKINNTKLIINISFKTSGYIKTMPLVILGGEDDPIIANEISYLLEKIINAGGYDEDESDDDKELSKGDRVVVIEEQHFKGDGIGQKGVIREIIKDNGVSYCTVSFDNHFNSKLFSYSSKTKNQNCWIFKMNELRKIKKEKWIY